MRRASKLHTNLCTYRKRCKPMKRASQTEAGAEAIGWLTSVAACCRLISYCPRHCTPKPQMSGVRLVSKEEEGRQKVKGDDGNGLWNAQLFPPPTLVPVPDCPSGSARMEPLQVSLNP